MTAILTAIAGAFGSVFTFLGAQIAARFGIQLAMVAVYVAAAATFLGVITSVFATLDLVLPQILVDGLAYLPTSLAPAMTAILAGEVAAYVYRQIVLVASVKTRI